MLGFLNREFFKPTIFFNLYLFFSNEDKYSSFVRPHDESAGYVELPQSNYIETKSINLESQSL